MLCVCVFLANEEEKMALKMVDTIGKSLNWLKKIIYKHKYTQNRSLTSTKFQQQYVQLVNDFYTSQVL